MITSENNTPSFDLDAALNKHFAGKIVRKDLTKQVRPEFFTNQYGFIVDYLAEFFREMRKYNFGDAIGRCFRLGHDLNQRDTIAVKRTVSGLLKLLYPHEEYDKEAVRECLEYALEARRRIKEQLKRIGGMEFFDVHLSYIDLETKEEKIVRVKEQGGDSRPGATGGLSPTRPGVRGEEKQALPCHWQWRRARRSVKQKWVDFDQCQRVAHESEEV